MRQYHTVCTVRHPCIEDLLFQMTIKEIDYYFNYLRI